MDAKDARHGLPLQIASARIMAAKLAEHMRKVCIQLFERHQEGTEIVSPFHALKPDHASEPLRASSEGSRVDREVDRQGWRQELINMIKAEVDERAVRFRKIITSKNRKISELKRQLAKAKKQLG